MPITYPVSYTTVAGMLTKLPELGSVTTLTSAHLATYAGEAQAYVDSRIVRNYSLPLTGDIPEIQRITTTLAVYFALQRLFTQERMNASTWPDTYKSVIDDVDKVAEGTAPLVTSSGAILGGRTDESELYTTTQGYHPTFHEGPWVDQVQDPDKIEDIFRDRDLL